MSETPLDYLGLDAEDLVWQQLATCKAESVDPKYFDEYYQSDPLMRPVVDDICISCPVLKECLMWGIEKKESFVWGGHYLENGKIVPDMNDHKSEDFNRLLVERINE